jgi:glycosyltransferase involved in cell wall biosynthesis
VKTKTSQPPNEVNAWGASTIGATPPKLIATGSVDTLSALPDGEVDTSVQRRADLSEHATKHRGVRVTTEEPSLATLLPVADRPISILHIVPYAGAGGLYGGPARGTFKQAAAATRAGNRADVLSLGPDTVVESRGDVYYYQFRAHRVPIRPRFAGLYSLRAVLWALMNARSYDIIHMHAGRELWVQAVIRLRRWRKPPFVWQTHGMLSPRTSVLIRSYDLVLTKPALRAAARLLSLTSYEDRDIRQVWPAVAVERVTNAIEDPVAQAPARPWSGVLRVVFVSRLHPRKRVLDLARAVLELRAAGRAVTLAIFGPDEGDLENLTLLMSEDHDGAISYGGSLDYGDVRAVLSRYDLLALPSISEPFPNILLEAMATGIPTLCTEQCGLAADISENSAGLVVTPGVQPIRDALDGVMNDPGCLAEYGVRGLQLVKDRFDVPSLWRNLDRIYRECVGDRVYQTSAE